MGEQRDEAWLSTATAEQIVSANDAGELDDLKGVERNEAGNRVYDLRGVGGRK
jgi:hypothetical protein